MFKEKDIKILKEKGISAKEAENQVGYLRKGFPFMKLAKAASINQGIKQLNDKQLKEFVLFYENSSDFTKMKFVPASGAATRMFKALFEFDELFRQSDFDAKILSREAYKHVKECFDRIKDFAFYPELEKAVEKQSTTVPNALKNKDYHIVLSALLTPQGMNYGNLPKGLLTFHRYGKHTRTAVEEHLVEGSGYAANQGAMVDIHLTVSPEHLESFEKLLKKEQKKYEEAYHVKYRITYSVQKPSTDTLAVDDKNEPFRESDGSLHFRPGGHGALLENLNDINADIVFIKNIDNVSHDRNKADTILYKKALAGMLIRYQEKIFGYMKELEKKNTNPEFLKEVTAFLSQELGTTVTNKFLQQQNPAEYLFNKLNRPLRICGMVKNSGEPGGGPFWTIDSDGSKSLQIVESSQVDMHDPEQAAILNSSTHFNPVDLVCALKDYKGRKFNLMNYRDANTGFISKKFKNGKPLKALELPGLWNGSMAHWNTVLVEVPGSTFTPVKTVYDLLRPEHQETV
ncbi:MAG TPA: DUF4301 family protein [Bacteroidales bacterium]|nr:DUF4301 family protein [Bacteroidales bacterium]